MIARIGELYETIRKAQEELDTIRKNCVHDQGYRIANYMWRIGSIYPSRICLVCDAAIDGITQEEDHNFRLEQMEKDKAWRAANGIPEEEYMTGVTVVKT
jgi:hypothetical protein